VLEIICELDSRARDGKLRQQAMQAWMGDEELDEPCVLRATTSREWLANAGLAGVFSINFGSKRTETIRVEGEQGRRVVIKRYDASKKRPAVLGPMLTSPSFN